MKYMDGKGKGLLKKDVRNNKLGKEKEIVELKERLNVIMELIQEE